MKLRLRETELFVGYEAVAALTAALLLDTDGRVICCISAAVMHECGHLLMMLCFRCRIKTIKLRLFDVQIGADQPQSRRADLLITSAGAAVNIIFAVLCLPFCEKLFFANLAIGCFNLLPMESLDGGRLLRLLLEEKLSLAALDRLQKILSFIFLVPFLFGGIWVLLNTRYNYSLLAVSLYLLTVILLKQE